MNPLLMDKLIVLTAMPPQRLSHVAGSISPCSIDNWSNEPLKRTLSSKQRREKDKTEALFIQRKTAVKGDFGQ
jgi:hypothetical protein